MRHYHQKRRHQKCAPRAVLQGLSGCLALAAIAASMAGCAVSVPIGSFMNASANAVADEDATGSIPSAPLERLLGPEDWRRAKAALSTALDPQGDGSPVNWDNPQSGVKGSFSPTSKAYPSDAKVCRRFSADVERKAGGKTMQGVACADKSGEWSIAEMASPVADKSAK